MIRLIALAVLAVASLTYAILQQWEITSQKNRITLLGRELSEARQAEAQAQAALQDAERDLQAAKANIARLTSERDAALARAKPAGETGEAIASAAASPAPPGEGKNAGFQAFAKMFETEEGRKMMKTQSEMATRMMYGDLAKTLNLSPQEADQVLALLTDRQAAMAEGQFKLMGQGKFNEEEVKKVSEENVALKKEYEGKLKNVLGEEKYQQMQDYERTLGDRMALVQYEQQFSSAGAPLQPEQKESLLKIMSAERKNSPPPIFDQTGQDPGKSFAAMRDEGAVDRYFEQEADYQRRVLAAATQTLNPDQINALQKGFEQMAQMQKFGMKMMQQMMKDGGGNQAPPAPPTPVETPR